jgi:hypothetical protein
MFITALKGRHFWKLSILLISFWFSACFIFAAYKLQPSIDLANFGDLRTVEGIGEVVEGWQKIQRCGSGNDTTRVDILRKTANKYDHLLEDKFTFVCAFQIKTKHY